MNSHGTPPLSSTAAPATRTPFGVWREQPRRLLELLDTVTAWRSSAARRYTNQRTVAWLLGATVIGLYFLIPASAVSFSESALRAVTMTFAVTIILVRLSALRLKRLLPPDFTVTSGGGIFVLVLVCAGLFFRWAATFSENISLGVFGSLLASLRWYDPSGLSASQVITLWVMIGLTAVSVLLWISSSRIRKSTPREEELVWGVAVLKPLLEEVPPNLRAEIRCTPIAVARRQEVLKSRGKKPVYADHLIGADLDLGDGRRFTFDVVHLRRSKGRNKHKGWKHKVKLKYAVSGETIRKADAVALEGRFRARIRQLNERVQISENQPWKFRTSLTSGTTITTLSSGRFLVSQTLGISSPTIGMECPVDGLLHPELILMTCRAISELFLSNAPQADSQLESPRAK